MATLGAPAIVPVVEVAAQQHRDLQRLEEAGTAILHVRIGALVLLGGVAFDGDPVVPLVVLQHRDDRESMGLHAGKLRSSASCRRR